MANIIVTPLLLYDIQDESQEIHELIRLIDLILLDIEGFTRQNISLGKRQFEAFFEPSDNEEGSV